MDNKEIASRVLAPGEETSEGQHTQSATSWAKIMIAVGGLGMFLPQMIDAIKQVPGVETSKTGSVVLSVLGVLVMISGAVMKMGVVSSYNNSRGLIKAAAIRDLDFAPSVVENKAA